MYSEDWVSDELGSLRSRGLERRLSVYPRAGAKFEMFGKSCLNLSSNDYLALAQHPAVIEGARRSLDGFGASSSASRLVTGTLPLHEQLEDCLAKFKGFEKALVFGSGYLANSGVLSAIAGRNDVMVLDKLCHASLIDGAVLSRVDLKRFRHNDVDDLNRILSGIPRRARQRVIVVTESVFSMDGDIAPLARLQEVCDAHDAMLYVDEAHAIGVFGPSGRGLVDGQGSQICAGTLGKALGSYGGFVVCSGTMKEYLVNTARSFIYSTSLPPSILGAAIEALTIVQNDPALGTRLLERSRFFIDACYQQGVKVTASESQIVPLIVGSNEEATELSECLKSQGVLAIAIRSPTVPAGTERIRFSVTLGHSEDDLSRAARILRESIEALRLQKCLQ